VMARLPTATMMKQRAQLVFCMTLIHWLLNSVVDITEPLI
jgi:hypothetical protein